MGKVMKVRKVGKPLHPPHLPHLAYYLVGETSREKPDPNQRGGLTNLPVFEPKF